MFFNPPTTEEKQRMAANICEVIDLWPTLSEPNRAEASNLIYEWHREARVHVPTRFNQTMRYAGEPECIATLQALVVSLAQ